MNNMPAQTNLFLCLKDNFGVLLHDPAERRDRRDRRAGSRAGRGRAEEHRLAAHRHPGDASSCRPHRRHRRAQSSITNAASSRRAARRRASRMSTRPCGEGDTVKVGALEGARHRNAGPHRRATSPISSRPTSSPSSATRCSRSAAAASSKAMPEMMWQSLLKLRGLPDDTQFYCGHEYTAANIRFAKTVEPNNKALAARADEVDAAARRRQADHPGDDRRGEGGQSVPARRRCRRWRNRSASPAARRGRCSRKSASARTGFEQGLSAQP